jgi:periplasmic copper chaperone A
MRFLAFGFRAGLLTFGLALQAGCSEPAPSPAMVTPVAQVGDIAVSEPRVRIPAAGRTQTAAYLTLTNSGLTRDAIIGASSPSATRVELHAHLKGEGGMMQMRRVPKIDLPEKTSIALSPGGLHVMIKDLKGPLNIGDRISMTLKLESGAELTFQAPVVANPRTLGEEDQQPSKGHQHH